MFTVENLQRFFDDAKSQKIGFKGLCHDCGKDVCIDIDMSDVGEIIVTGGALYYPQIGDTNEDRAFFIKCDACFKQNSELRNFKPCEVYSRVIGYLRPVSQWNDGKQAEFKLRKTFKV